MLKTMQYKQALKIAVEGGDPNNINKVLSEILKVLKQPYDLSAAEGNFKIDTLTKAIQLIS